MDQPVKIGDHVRLTTGHSRRWVGTERGVVVYIRALKFSQRDTIGVVWDGVEFEWENEELLVQIHPLELIAEEAP